MSDQHKAGITDRIKRMTDTNLLMSITIIVFIVMYLCAVLFLREGFLKPQTLFNIMNANAALIILSCGMSLVMITGGIDISVGTLPALVCMSCAVNLDFHGGTVLTAIMAHYEPEKSFVFTDKQAQHVAVFRLDVAELTCKERS